MKSPLMISLVAGLLAALVLAACGDSSDSSEPATTGSTASPGTTTEGDPTTGGTDAAGAGSSGEEPSLSDSEQVSAAIEALLGDPDNDFVCDQVLSNKLLQSAYGDRQGCRNQRQPELLSDGVKINDLKLDGGRATAVAIPKGGFYGGQELEIVAVREGETWRIEQFISNVPVGP